MGDKSTDEIRKDMWKAMADSPYVMLGLDGDRRHFEAMYAVLDKDADSEFWFYTKRSNRAAGGGNATVTFVSKGHDLFASIEGRLTEETRQDIKDKYWTSQVEAWYDQGRQDPELLIAPLRPVRCRDLGDRPEPAGQVQAHHRPDDQGRRAEREPREDGGLRVCGLDQDDGLTRLMTRWRQVCATFILILLAGCQNEGSWSSNRECRRRKRFCSAVRRTHLFLSPSESVVATHTQQRRLCEHRSFPL